MITERIKSREDDIQKKDIDLLVTRTATWRVRPVSQGMFWMEIQVSLEWMLDGPSTVVEVDK